MKSHSKQILFTTFLFLVLLFIFAKAPVNAAVHNKPIYATIQYVQNAISTALSPVQSSITGLTTRLSNLEATVTPIPGQIATIQTHQAQTDQQVNNLSSSQNALANRVSNVETATLSAISGFVWISHQSTNTSFWKSEEQVCPKGKMVISGGGSATISNAILDASYPEAINGSTYPNAWKVTYSNSPSDGNVYYITVYAGCVNAPQQ